MSLGATVFEGRVSGTVVGAGLGLDGAGVFVFVSVVDVSVVGLSSPSSSVGRSQNVTTKAIATQRMRKIITILKAGERLLVVVPS